jgi:hypothetical protein
MARLRHPLLLRRRSGSLDETAAFRPKAVMSRDRRLTRNRLSDALPDRRADPRRRCAQGNVNRALIVAGIVAAVELFVIAWVRSNFLRVSTRSSLVTLGGAIVLAIGVLVGNA